MGALSYTGLYQMTYLLLETAEGKLTNKTVNDTFQTFLYELNQTIQEQDVHDIHELEAVRNSIYDYYEQTVESEADIERVISTLTETFRAWKFESPAILELAKDVLNELL